MEGEGPGDQVSYPYVMDQPPLNRETILLLKTIGSTPRIKRKQIELARTLADKGYAYVYTKYDSRGRPRGQYACITNATRQKILHHLKPVVDKILSRHPDILELTRTIALLEIILLTPKVSIEAFREELAKLGLTLEQAEKLLEPLINQKIISRLTGRTPPIIILDKEKLEQTIKTLKEKLAILVLEGFST